VKVPLYRDQRTQNPFQECLLPVGFRDRHKDEFAVGQTAQRFGLVRFVEEDS